jgi:hypothetical protein
MSFVEKHVSARSHYYSFVFSYYVFLDQFLVFFMKKLQFWRFYSEKSHKCAYWEVFFKNIVKLYDSLMYLFYFFNRKMFNIVRYVCILSLLKKSLTFFRDNYSNKK